MIKLEQFTFTIRDELGIHARPAGLLVKTAAAFLSEIQLRLGGKQVSGKKIFAVMSLCAKKGDQIEVSVDGPDEKNAAAAMRAFFEEHL